MATKLSDTNKKTLMTALVANPAGEIFELQGYAAVGMAGSSMRPLTTDETLKMPHGSELMYLPDRHPVLLNLNSGKLETVKKNPYVPGEDIYPVAAFNSPGYVITWVSAFREGHHADYLPLFSYGAVGWHQEKFRSAAILVDPEPRQDLRRMKR